MTVDFIYPHVAVVAWALISATIWTALGLAWLDRTKAFDVVACALYVVVSTIIIAGAMWMS